MDLIIIFLFILTIVCLASLFLSLALYFIPVIIAYIRKHNNIVAISILNIALGWTFVGWLGALLWALNPDISNNENN